MYSCLWILPQTHVFYLSKCHNQLLILIPIHTALVADWIQCVTSQTFQDPTIADLTCSVGENKCQQMARGVTLIKQTQDECVCFRLLASVGEVWIGFKGTGIMMVIVSVWKTTPESQMFQKPPCFFNACVQSNCIAAIFRLVHTETAFRPEGANELLAPLAPVFAQPRRKAIRYEVTRCCQHLSIALAYSPPSWSPYMTDDSWGDNNPTAGSVMSS